MTTVSPTTPMDTDARLVASPVEPTPASNSIAFRAAILLAPGEGKTVTVLGNEMVFKAGGQETDGGLFVMEYTAQARFAGPPPHAHPHADEAFYVLEGTLTLRRAEGDVEAAAGSFCYVPRGVAHTFANRTDVPARFLSLMTPAGFEGYLEELATVVQPGVPMPGPDVFAALNKKYDQVPAVLPGA